MLHRRFTLGLTLALTLLACLPAGVHFEVTGKVNRVITQMYFPGEPLNDKDLLLQNIRANKEGLIAEGAPADIGSRT